MKNYLFIGIGILVFASFKLCSQSIIAGQIPVDGYYYDFSPDTTLVSFQNFHNEQLDIDINNDGQADFRIYTYNYGGLGGGGSRISIQSYNNNEVSFDFIDSCFAGPMNHLIHTWIIGQALNTNDTISNTGNWTNSDCKLNYTRFGAHVDSLDNMYSYNCSVVSFESQAKYIGVRIISNDTLYGWIKVSGTTYSTVTIEEYASESIPLNVNNLNATSAFEVYPNPCQNYFEVRVADGSNATGTLYIQNHLGQIMNQSRIDGNQMTIETSTLLSGMYFVILELGEHRYSKKFLKVD